ncbi:sce7726 family protein [Ruegeria sp. SCP11]|uniref:sce7726 family protein n=1 Tax=Ruegeria sp. SCP11 TaxID=3141378 RepID=UPI00333CA308
MKDNLDLAQDSYATEVQIRTALVRRLVADARSKNSILAAEAVYGFENRRADLLKLDEYSHAFEIKSDYDNTSRLPGQLAEYSKTFDFVTVVTTHRLLPSVREIAPRKAGLMVFDGQTVNHVRKPTINKQLSKFHLASGTTKARLLSALPASQRRKGVTEVRTEAAKRLNITALRNMFRSELEERFAESSAAFFSETDAQIAAEDLLLLRRSSRLFT